MFVGRERELAQLDSFLERALAGQGQVVLISGEAGSGKTALLQAFAQRAEQANAELVIAVGKCNAQTGLGDPYLPFREILRLLTGDVESDLSDNVIDAENATRLRGLLLNSAQVLVELGPELVSLLLAGVPGAGLAARVGSMLVKKAGWMDRLEKLVKRTPTAPAEASLDQSHIFEQCTATLQALSKQHPLVLALDDVQWADAASISLLFHLSREISQARILLLVAYRPDEVALGRGDQPHPLEKVLSEFKRYFGDICLTLDRPDEAEGRRFVDAVLDAEPNRLSEEFRTALFHHTEGHPLFTIELLRDMQERGDILRDEGGRWVQGPALCWDALPARVEGVIEERIQRLQKELRDILSVASVEGEDFTVQVIARVQEMQERQLLRALSQELEKRHHLVHEEAEIKVGSRFLTRYQFGHTLFQQYLYNELSGGERRLLHGQIAELLEELYHGCTDEITVQLARHYSEAGKGDKAIDYLLRAGDKARALYAYTEAIDYYQRALAFLKEQRDVGGQRAARTLMKLGLTYHIAFDFRRARQAYEEGFALWQQAREPEPGALPPAPHAFRTASSAPRTLDPAMAGESVSSRLVEQLFRGLVEHSPDMDIIPDLARSWEVLEDGRKYVFHLRDDALWSDGTPVTADDFEFAWKRALHPATGAQVARMLYDVKGAKAFHRAELTDPEHVGIHASDAWTLHIELEEPSSYFLHLLAYPVTFAVPRHVVEAHGAAWTEADKLVSNGPFRLQHWQPGQRIVLVRNAGYHGRSTGNLQQIETLFTTDMAEILSLYEANALDAIVLQTPATSGHDHVRQRHAEEYLSGPVFATVLLSLDAMHPPFYDARVRRALAMAVNRERLADVLAQGFAFPALGGFVPPGMPGHSPGIGLPYAPEQARWLLAEAGYPGGRGFPRLEGRTPRLTVTTEYLTAQWQENLGIEVAWQACSYEEVADLLSRDPPPMIVDGWIADYPDPDSFLRGAVQTYLPGWLNESYSRLVEQARRVTDQRERMKLYQQADRLLVEEAVIVPISYSRLHLLVKPWVTRFPISPLKYWFFKDVVIAPH